MTNINDNNRTMNNIPNNINNNNIKKLYQKQVDNKTFDRNKTINNTCRNKSGTFTN